MTLRKSTSTLAVALVAGAVALLGGARSAAAQSDAFACPAVLPACTADVNDCCYKPFLAGSIIIPMDRCHQPVANSAKMAPPTPSDGSSSATFGPIWCADPPAYHDLGQTKPYGLVYRMLQAGIPIHFVTNPTKDPPLITPDQALGSQMYTHRDVDMWVIGTGNGPECAGPPVATANLPAKVNGSCESPVTHLRIPSAGGSPLVVDQTPYLRGALPLRNAMVVDAADAARFKELVTRTGEFASKASDPNYDFSAINLYEMNAGSRVAYQNFAASVAGTTIDNAAPILNRLDFAPPRIARLTSGGSTAWLGDAGLGVAANAGCATSLVWTPSNAVYCDVTEAQIGAGVLVDYKFDYLWMDSYSPNCGTAPSIAASVAVKKFLTAVKFVRNAGNVFVQGSSVVDIEACNGGDWRFMSQSGLRKATGQVADNTSTSGGAGRVIIRYANNILTQWGDFPIDFQPGSAGAAFDSFGAGANGFKAIFTAVPATSTLRRLVTEEGNNHATNPFCVGHTPRSPPSPAGCDKLPANGGSTDRIDGAAYIRYLNVAENGVVFYTGGQNVQGSAYSSQLRMLLNTLLTLPTNTVIVAPQSTEVARSSSVTTEIAGALVQLLGTYGVYEPANPTYTSYPGTSYAFPIFHGHMRAYDPTALSNTATTYETAAAYWDAATVLEARTTDDRVIFTNIPATAPTLLSPTSTSPPRVLVTTANATTLRTRLGMATDAEASALIGKIRRGYTTETGSPFPRLGGVDRSTPAVIEASPQTRSNRDRPTMVYFGALDGMIHAVCGETNPTYGCAGPGHELWAFIPRTQLGLIKSNTTRIDGSVKVADVFDDFGAGKEYRTVLTFQTAVGNPLVPVDASQAPAAYALDITNPSNPTVLWERILPGPGLNMAMGPVQVGPNQKELTFISSSVKSGAGALQVTALDSRTGAQVWQQTRANTLGAPFTALPGGVAAVDEDGDSFITDIIATNVDGTVYRMDAATGNTPAGIADPLLSFADARHAIGGSPTIWKDAAGVLHVLVATGGYVDNTTYTTVWAPLGTNQFVVSIPITRATTLVMNGAAPIATYSGGGAPDFAVTYGATSRAFGQVTVAGGTFFLVTDSDVEPNAQRYGLVENTGQVFAGNLSTGAMEAPVTTGGGTAAAEVAAGTVYAAGGRSGIESETGLLVNPDGAGTELTFDLKTVRQLWLRLQ